MKLSRMVHHGILSLAFTAAGAGVMGVAWDKFETTPEPYAATEADTAFVKYQAQLDKITKRQADLSETTDEEGTDAHENRKRVFITDTLVDENLSEKQLIRLAEPFNKLGTEDGIVFRAFNANKFSLSKRDECLATTPANDSDSIAAQRVENCMEALISQREPNVELATALGAILGFGFYGSFAAGKSFGRRRAVKPA